MSIVTRFSSLAAVLAVVAGAALATASPAVAKEHKIYNDRQAWAKVDQNHDGAISKKEWKWAEKHGYDRLNGVPKKHLTRAEYQRYLDEYLSRRYANNNNWGKNSRWRTNQNDHNQHGWNDDGSPANNTFIRRTDGRDHDRD